MIVLVGEDAIVRAWVSQKTGDPHHEGETLGMLSNDKRLIGGFIFTNWTGAGIELTMAGRGCMSRLAWQAVGDFVFRHKGCERLQVTTRASNKHVCRLIPRMKFRFEGTARRAYGNEDGKVFSLLRNEAIQLGYYREIM